MKKQNGIKYQLREMNLLPPLLAGTLCALGFLVALVVGNGFYLYDIVLTPRGTLPFAVFIVFSLLCVFALGFISGCALFLERCQKRCPKGYISSAACLFLIFIWFALFFSSAAFFIALISAVFALVLEIYSFTALKKVYSILSLLSLIPLLYCIYVLWFTFCVLLLN